MKKELDIKKLIQDPRVKKLKGNAFKFLFELYSLSDTEGLIENFTIYEFADKAKIEDNGNSTSRNSLAKYLQEFIELDLLSHDRYKKEIVFNKKGLQWI